MDLFQQERRARGIEVPDLFGFSAGTLDTGVRHYASGVLSPSIFEGYRRAGAPVCIAASEMGKPALERALAYADAGGEILVDSGAFIWKDQPNQMPWLRVISHYKALAAVATGPLTFILPDQVGSQAGSLKALAKYGPAIQEAIGDHPALLPLQVGPHSPGEYVRLASELLSRPVDGLAVPSHAAAFPPQQLRQLAGLPESIPRRIHFLGISRNSRGLRERILYLQEAWQDCEVSCDACLHRAHVGEGRFITESRRSSLDGYWDQELEGWDDTEVDPEASLEMARQRFPDLNDEDLEALLLSPWGSHIDTHIRHQQNLKDNGPRATADSIYQFAISGR